MKARIEQAKAEEEELGEEFAAGGAEAERTLAAFYCKNCVEVEKGQKYQCQLAFKGVNKSFRAPEFVVKHLWNKHPGKVRDEVYLMNYMMDHAMPLEQANSSHAHQQYGMVRGGGGGMRGGGPGGMMHHSASPRDRFQQRGGPGGMMMMGRGGGGMRGGGVMPPPHMMAMAMGMAMAAASGGGFPPMPRMPMGGGGGGGGQGGSPGGRGGSGASPGGRQDPRGIKAYVDLDAAGSGGGSGSGADIDYRNPSY